MDNEFIKKASVLVSLVAGAFTIYQMVKKEKKDTSEVNLIWL